MKPNGSFFQVHIRQIQSEREEDVADLCFEAGATGVSQDLQFQQPDLVYEAEIVDTSRIDLNAFFEAEPPAELLLRLRELDSTAEVIVSQKPNEDWMENWKKHFAAFCLTGPYWIVPSWLPAPTEARRILRIDPGMAFGTGTHATTQIASRMVVDCLQEKPLSSALDVGTGTGVLAMLMAMEGIPEVEATEIDPMARETAVVNLGLNDLQRVKVHDVQIEELAGPYDLVVANIIDGILVRLREDLFRLTRPGGLILVAGILEERRADFLLRFQYGLDLRLLKEESQDEWWGYLFRRES